MNRRWPQGEALYGTLLAYLETGDHKWLRWVERLHAYIYTFFYDGERDPFIFYRKTPAPLARIFLPTQSLKPFDFDLFIGAR